jgi:hypothetical protein
MSGWTSRVSCLCDPGRLPANKHFLFMALCTLLSRVRAAYGAATRAAKTLEHQCAVEQDAYVQHSVDVLVARFQDEAHAKARTRSDPVVRLSDYHVQPAFHNKPMYPTERHWSNYHLLTRKILARAAATIERESEGAFCARVDESMPQVTISWTWEEK